MTRRVEIAPEDWDCVRLLSDETPEGRVEVGPKEDLLAPIDFINMVSQVRQEYDPDDLAELKQAMITEDDNGEKRIQLIQPITVGYFHKNDLREYLEKLNSTWGTEHTVNELTSVPGSHGRYYLLVVAGHRRTLAIRQAAEDLEIDVSRIDVVFHVMQGTDFTFREGIKTQYRENFHKRPESWEDAIAIGSILREGISNGEYNSFADCARDLGIPSERVSKAYRFNELPTYVKSAVEKGLFGYGAAVELHQIAVALAHNLARARYTEDELQQFLYQYDAGKALLSDVLPYLTAEELESWDTSITTTHFEKLQKMRMSQVSKYVRDKCAALVKYEQLTLGNESEKLNLKKSNRSAISAAKTMLRGALGEIVTHLDSEAGRLSRGQPTLVQWSPKLIDRIAQVNDSLDALTQQKYDLSVDELQKAVRLGIEAGRLALSELVDEIPEPDVMTVALNDDQPSLLG